MNVGRASAQIGKNELEISGEVSKNVDLETTATGLLDG
jgi:hypothetical protein